MDADGPERPRRDTPAVILDELSTGEHDVAHDAPVLLHHQVEFGDKVGIISKLVEDEVLGASRAINVPESLAGEVFHLAVIMGLL